jgi:hypothetical protein
VSRTIRTSLRAALPPLSVALVVGVTLAASTLVPASRAGGQTDSITANKLKPAACAGLRPERDPDRFGTFTDGNQPHLVLGSATADIIRGGAGNDCIPGGAGADSLRGDAGTDVCIGGPGTDTFYATCETRIQ